jgi:hypothetical protein
MHMHFRAVIDEVEGKVRAHAVDFEAVGEGATRQAALAALREALLARLAPEAVAPPEDEEPTTLEIEVVPNDAEDHAREPTGPGDSCAK